MSQVSKEKKKAWIAISGNMASGKSSVLAYLHSEGYDTFDCDSINADLQQIGQKGYQQILELFGDEYLDENKNLDRKKMASKIFSNVDSRKQLEAIMHPLILEKLNEIKKNSRKTTFIEVPLLFELNWQNYFDESWLVVSDSSNLIERCIENRKMNKDQIMARLNAQMSADLKKEKATIVIENNGDLKDLYKKIDKLLERGHYE